MMTIKQLLKQRGKLWAERAPDDLPSEITLLWHAAGELASMLELIYEPEDMQFIAPRAVEILRGSDAFFKDIDAPPHQALAMVLLKLERVNYGLSPLGEETSKPQ
jgi:hypothetical protein